MNTDRLLSKELMEQRNLILGSAVQRAETESSTKKRDTKLVTILIGAVAALQAMQHPLSVQFMNYLAFSFPGRSAFAESCKMAGLDIPPLPVSDKSEDEGTKLIKPNGEKTIAKAA